MNTQSANFQASQRGRIWIVGNLSALIVLGVVVLIGTHHALRFLAWAGGSFAVGGLVGLLFAMPKIIQDGTPVPIGGPPPVPSPDPSKIAETSVQGPVRATAEARTGYCLYFGTHLSDVSDWLTKILVGLGLVNLKSLPTFLSSTAQTLDGTGANNSGTMLMEAALTYFTIIGFLYGYLVTRLFLAEQIVRADAIVIDLADDIGHPRCYVGTVQGQGNQSV